MNDEAISSEQQDWTEISDPAQLPEKPLVSVLMLTYNHGPYLAEAIEGVVNQITDFPVELLIGEDCSKDNTLQVARDYQKKYPQIIRILHACPNRGFAENFRRLIRASRGEFSAFCEGDDYWIDREKLAHQLDIIRDNVEVVIVHADHVIRQDFWGKAFIVNPRGRFADLKDKAFVAGDISEKCFGGLVTHTSTVLCRTRHLKEYLETDFVRSAGFAYDLCVMNYLALHGKAAYLDRLASAYRITPGSLMRSGTRGHLKMALEIRDFFVSFRTATGKYASCHEDIYKSYTKSILKNSFRIGDKEKFLMAARDLDGMQLTKRDRLIVKLHKAFYDLAFARELLAHAATFVQGFRKIKSMLFIRVGFVDRIMLSSNKIR